MAKKPTHTTDRTPAAQQFHAVRMSETTFRSLPADLRTPRTGRGKTKPATPAKTTKAVTKTAAKAPAKRSAKTTAKATGKPTKTGKAASRAAGRTKPAR